MECSVQQCERGARTRGYCGMHYQRLLRTGDATTPPAGKGGRPYVDAQCSAAGCERLVNSRGLCMKHYQRWLKSGDPLVVKREVSQLGPEATFRANVDQRGPDECWPWKRPPMGAGYGQIQWTDGTVWNAHRVAYLLAHGQIPASEDPRDPIEIDHLCHDPDECGLTATCPHRLCCNPAHLEAKPRSANTARTCFHRRCTDGCTCWRHPWGFKRSA
jgi:hypothetical protein